MAKVETLTSAQNALLKDVRRAARSGGLTENGFCLAESFHLLEEALRSRCQIGAVLTSQSASLEVERLLGSWPALRLIVVPDRLFEGLAATEASQGVLALVRLPAWNLGQVLGILPLVVVLDGIQDPGNAGAIVRAAEAFHASGLIFVKGAANPHNPKTIRASAGSIFRVPLVHGMAAGEAGSALAERRVAVFAAVSSEGRPVHEADWTKASAIIIGNEGRGISDSLRRGAAAVRIPTDQVESLNAAMAAGILLYEARRQRMESGL